MRPCSPASLPFLVHPHGRGEYGLVIARIARTARFTPTGVGNTPKDLVDICGSPVHPHGRGEYALSSKRFPFTSGSPPRAWGIRPTCWPIWSGPPVHPHGRGEYPPGLYCHDASARFTPTGVGNTVRVQ